MLQLNTTPFFNPAHFAQEAKFAGLDQPVLGIFDDASAVGDVGELGMSTTHPTLQLPSTQVPTAVRGMQVQVAGQYFTVEDTQPYGTGMTLLILEVLHD